MSIELISKLALEKLNQQGFEDIVALESDDITGNTPRIQPVSVTDLDGTSNFTIVPVDATSTQEFKDFIYVAIEQGTDELLEIAKLSDAPKIYNDQEMEAQLQTIFPVVTFQIESGYFWKFCFELRSRLSVARRFSIDGKKMFLLPNGEVTEQLSS
jgi:hypothetical protein